MDKFYKTRQYQNIHAYLNRTYGKANCCKNKNCLGKSEYYDWALKKGKEYSRNIDDYEMLCRACHVKKDAKNKSKKLSNTQILEINKRLKNGERFSEIRRIYNISNDTIRRLYQGNYNNLDWSFMYKRKIVINKINFKKMKDMILKGIFVKEIAEELNLNYRYIPDLFKKIEGISIRDFLIKNKVVRKYRKTLAKDKLNLK